MDPISERNRRHVARDYFRSDPTVDEWYESTRINTTTLWEEYSTQKEWKKVYQAVNRSKRDPSYVYTSITPAFRAFLLLFKS